MKYGLNSVTLMGNLGTPVTLRQTTTGKAVASFRLATTEKIGDGERTEWHNIVVWNGAAEVAHKYLAKGSSCLIQGRIQTRAYDKDGDTKYITEIVAVELRLLGKAPS